MIDLFEQCTTYKINLDKCSTEVKKQLLDELGEYLGNCVFTRNEILKYSIDDSAINYESAYTDFEMIEDILINKLGDFPHYLVFAKGCRWNGTSGYKFCGDILDTIERPYDISISIVKEYKNTIECIESSHDVPMGSTTYICGITNKEYEKLEYADFNDIYQFVMNKLV